MVIQRNLLNSVHLLQKRFVRMATDNTGSWAHTPPLFRKLNLLSIYDIYKLQLGLLVYESKNNIGPISNIMNFTNVNEIHHHTTRCAHRGDLFINSVRTTRYGLKSIQVGSAKLWTSLPNHIKEIPSKTSFKLSLKKCSLIVMNNSHYCSIQNKTKILFVYLQCTIVLQITNQTKILSVKV